VPPWTKPFHSTAVSRSASSPAVQDGSSTQRPAAASSPPTNRSAPATDMRRPHPADWRCSAVLSAISRQNPLWCVSERSRSVGIWRFRYR
jgi:hypothetical protein